MKKTIYVLFLSLFVCVSCSKEEQIQEQQIQDEQGIDSAAKNHQSVKDNLCHYDAVTGLWSVVSVRGKAATAHLNHGDVLLVDADGDGYVEAINQCVPGGDCDDTNAAINPGATEVCDGVDNDCDGYSDIFEIGCTTPPSDMISWWDGDSIVGNTAEDIQGTNDGALPNGVIIAPGKVGDAFSFNGSNYMIAESSIINGFEELTIDMWVKPSLNYGNSLQAIAGIQTFHASPTESTGFYTRQSDGRIVFGINTISGIAGTTGIGDYGVPPDQWTHIAATYDGSTLKLYINGELVPNQGSNIGSTSINGNGSILQGPIQLSEVPNHYFAVGTSHWRAFANDFPKFGFYGEIDEIEIFERALTQSEIQAIYDADSAGKCKPCNF